MSAEELNQFRMIQSVLKRSRSLRCRSGEELIRRARSVCGCAGFKCSRAEPDALPRPRKFSKVARDLKIIRAMSLTQRTRPSRGLFPVPCSLFPVPCSLFPVPCPLVPLSPCPLSLRCQLSVERRAAIHIPAIQSPLEPLLPLRARSVRPALGAHRSPAHLL